MLQVNSIFKSTMLVLILHLSIPCAAQNTRINEQNKIGWFNFNSTFKISDKFGLHTEYQLRRDNFITDKQQNLLRLGVNYQCNEKVQLRLGYAWIETYPYGETPINNLGRDFTEHRFFQQVTLFDEIGKFNISHRFMLEQRWLGKYSSSEELTEDQYVFVNRLRYMFRAQIPLNNKKMSDNKVCYAGLYDEIFLGFGKNVNENVFDQNRFAAFLGYKFNNNARVEAGYLNQTLQLGREINNSNVFQNNNGFIISTLLNFDLTKKVKQ